MDNVNVLINSKDQPLDWRKSFRRVSQLDEGPVKMLIDGIIPDEGVVFIGSLSGVGKTWVALSMAKALRTQKPFLGRFAVPEKVPVAYLVPEMGSRSIRNRVEKLGIPDDDCFRLWTLKEGRLRLNNPSLKAMIQEVKPVVFLDTAIRFSTSKDENSSAENAVGLAEAIFTLLRLGARAVVCLHHAPKTSAKQPCMTLENILRGTGDFGAMCEVVWGIERARRKKGGKWDHEYSKESERLTRLYVECLKGRDIPDVADPFIIQGRPYIDERGDFALLKLGDLTLDPGGRSTEERVTMLRSAIAQDTSVSQRTLSRATGWSTSKVKDHALAEGFIWLPEKGWTPKPDDPIELRLVEE